MRCKYFLVCVMFHLIADVKVGSLCTRRTLYIGNHESSWGQPGSYHLYTGLRATLMDPTYWRDPQKSYRQAAYGPCALVCRGGRSGGDCDASLSSCLDAPRLVNEREFWSMLYWSQGRSKLNQAG